MTDSPGLPSIIAIDGPAASGKSTLGLRLAKSLGYMFFDTGTLYRAVTWGALEMGLDMGDEAAISALAGEADIDLRAASVEDGRTADVLLDGEDITPATRSRPVDVNVSIVAAYPGVRKALLQRQQNIGRRGKVVMVGRDIGTAVLPEADLKIYLDASAEERARRRFDELRLRGEHPDYEQILAQVRERDRIDSTRSASPLRKAEDALVVNTDGLTPDETLARVQEIVRGG